MKDLEVYFLVKESLCPFILQLYFFFMFAKQSREDFLHQSHIPQGGIELSSTQTCEQEQMATEMGLFSLLYFIDCPIESFHIGLTALPLYSSLVLAIS